MLGLDVTNDPYALRCRLGHANARVIHGVYRYSIRDVRAVADVLDELPGGDLETVLRRLECSRSWCSSEYT